MASLTLVISIGDIGSTEFLLLTYLLVVVVYSLTLVKAALLRTTPYKVCILFNYIIVIVFFLHLQRYLQNV